MKCMTAPVSIVLLLFSFSSFAQLSSESVPVVSNSEIESNQSIVKHTENSKNHKTLLAAIKAADLEDILSYDGPFTVFAPSDTAFRKLSKYKLAELLHPENKKELQALMTYHIVAGNFSASKILKAMCQGEGKASFTTVQGDELVATMQGTDIILTDNNGNIAKITTADSNQCNGVVHEIDSVFRPSKI